MQHLLSSLYFTVVFLYMFRELFAPIIRSSKNCIYNHWYKSQNVVVGAVREVPPTDDYRIRAPTTTFYDLYQWLYMQFLELLMMGAKSSRNM
jgi:hypothetical protein